MKSYNKYFLIYTEGDSPEDYSVFYCDLVLATNKDDALINYFELNDIPQEERYMFGAEEKQLIDLR